MDCSEKIILNFIQLFLEERNTKMIRKWNPQNNEYNFEWRRNGSHEIIIFSYVKNESVDSNSFPSSASISLDLCADLKKWIPLEIMFTSLTKYCNHQIELYSKEPWFF